VHGDAIASAPGKNGRRRARAQGPLLCFGSRNKDRESERETSLFLAFFDGKMAFFCSGLLAIV
jgi:hypothetical protein